MRLIEVIHGWPPETMGGTGLYVAALSRALQEAGHEVVVVSPGRGIRPRLERVEADGLTGWRIVQPPALSWSGGWQRKAGLRLWRRLLAAEQPDQVHVHHLSGLPLGLVGASREAGVPVALTLHDYWLACHRGQLVDRELRPCDGPTPTGCARCFTGRDVPRARDERRAKARSQAAAEVLASVDVLWSPSEDLSRRLISMDLPKATVCPLPLIHTPAPQESPSSGPVRFLFASSIIPTKGPQHLLQAFAKLPPGPTLTLAGHAPGYDGHPDFHEALATQAAATPGVRWLGAVSPAQMPALMAEHDVLVLPSIWPENSPLVVREATAAGLRVIASRLGGAAELAQDACLVEPGSVESLAAALAAEVARGRERLPRRQWQTPEEHARWFIEQTIQRDEAYTRD